MSDEPLQPSQEAREAAERLYANCPNYLSKREMTGAFARFEALIRADQRERDAKVAEDHDTFDYDTVISARQAATSIAIAAAIRKDAP